MLKRTVGLVLCAALCACKGAGGGNSLRITERTTVSSSLGMSVQGEDKKWVKVRTEGTDTIIDFHGREFVFKNLTGYEGRLTLDRVALDIGDAEVVITLVKVEVEQPGRLAAMEHLRVRQGQRIIYSAGSLWAE